MSTISSTASALDRINPFFICRFMRARTLEVNIMSDRAWIDCINVRDSNCCPRSTATKAAGNSPTNKPPGKTIYGSELLVTQSVVLFWCTGNFNKTWHTAVYFWKKRPKMLLIKKRKKILDFQLAWGSQLKRILFKKQSGRNLSIQNVVSQK